MYARNKFFVSREGFNNRLTGILWRSNKAFTIHASVENNTIPLSCVQFNQFEGERVNLKGKEIWFQPDEQAIIVDDFQIENYKNIVNQKESFYIVKNILQEEQSQNIKIN